MKTFEIKYTFGGRDKETLIRAADKKRARLLFMSRYSGRVIAKPIIVEIAEIRPA